LLRKRRLPSGVSLGPPWPIRLLNTLGPLVGAAGLWPSIDTQRMMRSVERKLKRNDWPAPLLRALPPRAAAFNDDSKPSLFGALVLQDQFKKSAMNALGFEDLISRHPEILEERIERPLFVLGLARTGTTLLQRLLSLHSGARYLPFWEAYSPVPYKLGKHRGGRDGRYGEAKRKLRLLKWVGPEFDKIHPIDVNDPEECYHLFRSHFLIPPGFDFGYVPSYWEWWDTQAHADVYRMHKRQLQALQWLDRRQHWVLKCPNHLSGIDHLLDVYPDARIVYTHREPEKIIASLCSLAAVTWSMTSDDVDLDQVAEYALNVAQRCQAAGRAALRTTPRDQILHVDYDDLVADPIAMARRVYEHFGYPADPSLDARMADWLASHPSDRHGKHTYRLSDFGLTENDVRRRLEGESFVAAQ
jgi:Sulfotransferase family